MLKVETLTLGIYQTNTYIVHDSESASCAVIDPGYDAQRILKTVSDLGLTVDAILLTHGHFDHVGAAEEIVEATGCKLWMSESDWSQFPNPVTAYYYPLANCDFTEVCFCEEDEHIHAGGLTFVTWHTAGHTWGSVCFVCQGALFSGDTLFAGSCGRMDLPGGDRDAMHRSLERLAETEGNYTVYPGHGPKTTLAAEKMFNPYMR